MLEGLVPARSRRRISLTPLIDVVFILLMFFMLTASFNQWRALPLLAPVAGEPAVDNKPRQLVLADNGELRAAGESLGQCDQQPLDGFDADLLVAPAASVSLQQLVLCLEYLRDSGRAVSLMPALPPEAAR